MIDYFRKLALLIQRWILIGNINLSKLNILPLVFKSKLQRIVGKVAVIQNYDRKHRQHCSNVLYLILKQIRCSYNTIGCLIKGGKLNNFGIFSDAPDLITIPFINFWFTFDPIHYWPLFHIKISLTWHSQKRDQNMNGILLLLTA